jgi:hypothetical protein
MHMAAEPAADPARNLLRTFEYELSGKTAESLFSILP